MDPHSDEFWEALNEWLHAHRCRGHTTAVVRDHNGHPDGYCFNCGWTPEDVLPRAG